MNSYPNASFGSGQNFQDDMRTYLEMLNEIKVEMKEYVLGAISDDSDTANTQIIIASIIFVVVIILTPTLVWMMHNLTTSIQVVTLCRLGWTTCRVHVQDLTTFC